MYTPEIGNEKNGRKGLNWAFGPHLLVSKYRPIYDRTMPYIIFPFLIIHFALWIPIHYSCFTEQSLLPPLRSLTHEWRLTHFPWFLRVAVCFWSWVNSYSNRLHVGICMIVSACDGDVLCFTGVYTHFRYRVDKSMRNLKLSRSCTSVRQYW